MQTSESDGENLPLGHAAQLRVSSFEGDQDIVKYSPPAQLRLTAVGTAEGAAVICELGGRLGCLLGDEEYETGEYVTTLHAYCTAEYTLTAMLAGTYSVALPVLQGAKESAPKASPPMFERDVGSVILVRLLHRRNANWPMVITLVGMLMLDRLVQ